MFTGIIETLGIVTEINKEQNNLHLTLSSSITPELKIDPKCSPQWHLPYSSRYKQNPIYGYRHRRNY